MLLDKWCLTPDPRAVWAAPEMRGKCLHGIVQGSPSFEDGAKITTTRLVKVEVDEASQLWAHTASGSLYQLGDIDPEYEAAFPDAANRVLKVFGDKHE